MSILRTLLFLMLLWSLIYGGGLFFFPGHQCGAWPNWSCRSESWLHQIVTAAIVWLGEIESLKRFWSLTRRRKHRSRWENSPTIGGHSSRAGQNVRSRRQSRHDDLSANLWSKYFRLENKFFYKFYYLTLISATTAIPFRISQREEFPLFQSKSSSSSLSIFVLFQKANCSNFTSPVTKSITSHSCTVLNVRSHRTRKY